jgi:hypothetical protein
MSSVWLSLVSGKEFGERHWVGVSVTRTAPWHQSWQGTVAAAGAAQVRIAQAAITGGLLLTGSEGTPTPWKRKAPRTCWRPGRNPKCLFVRTSKVTLQSRDDSNAYWDARDELLAYAEALRTGHGLTHARRPHASITVEALEAEMPQEHVRRARELADQRARKTAHMRDRAPRKGQRKQLAALAKSRVSHAREAAQR